MSHYLAITCSALARSIYAIAADAPATVSVQLLDQGLHEHPKHLRNLLQDQIDTVPANTYDAILLVYGICGTATVNLQARDIPLVIPRAHDCVTLYLGSREQYQEEFDTEPGTYWYSRDYLERSTSSGGLGAFSPTPDDDLYKEYVKKYGEKNAKYLIEMMTGWAAHYKRAVFIDTGSGESEKYEQITRDEAEKNSWEFKKLPGNRRLLTMLLHGDWDDEEFLTVPPGHKIQQTPMAGGLVKAVPAEE